MWARRALGTSDGNLRSPTGIGPSRPKGEVMATRRLYLWCSSGGDYHQEVYCPNDGSSFPEAADVLGTAGHLTRTGRSVSIERLRAAGLSETALRRVVVADFGDERSAFDILSPEQLGWRWHGGRTAMTPSRAVVRLYFRCDGGDHHESDYSPLDGWSAPEAKEIASTAARLTSTGLSVSIERLRAEGISQTALRRLIVVEFGDERAAFWFLHLRTSARGSESRRARPPGDS
jgi:hypothetical protein